MSLKLIGILGVLFAFIMNYFISQINPFLLPFVNLYSIPIIFIGMKQFRPSSIIISATAGILEDISSFFPIGVNALKKLILLFLVNRFSNFVSISSFFGYMVLILCSVFLEIVLLFLITGFFGLKNPFGEFYELFLLLFPEFIERNEIRKNFEKSEKH